MVNAALTISVGSPETAVELTGAMDSPFISGRPALCDAAELIEQFGDDACLEAAVRAERSRDAGNVVRFAIGGRSSA